MICVFMIIGQFKKMKISKSVAEIELFWKNIWDIPIRMISTLTFWRPKGLDCGFHIYNLYIVTILSIFSIFSILYMLSYKNIPSKNYGCSYQIVCFFICWCFVFVALQGFCCAVVSLLNLTCFPSVFTRICFLSIDL